MKVHELKEILNNYDDTADVFFFTGYSTIPYYELLDRQEVFNSGICTQGIAMEIEAAERLDTINTLILTPTGEEFKQAKLNLNHWKNYDNLSRAEYFNQSKIKALVAPLDILKIEADEIAGIAAADWLKLEDISEEACSELEKTLTAAVMKWLEKHSLKPDFYESISSVQAHGIDDYFKKK